ncbi:UTP--glucose-1-phosphate uridylyltransferase GalU [Bacillus inaquosorum]|uniref:UTP--glucose-1-phosphate uridylyltransferase GalU n=1 Tax=Bacillus inaquosorum TaxID=483913 RepID=UPI000745B882|nr:UTP--glucose-1-phosphate uridylyltransferase GalU [Bacillus inaquosorum]PPA37746.1 UTP--glucose-1-phosphate uridylyltransferase [Bacillus subtilis]AMA52506.1 UTP--glucose-1-phosphate uridylyltransferase [Bacillus inaquosorum]MBT2192878.1 UTP--glucose-1-phosphate uridylyltransferase GalU [Bacillus inaquosorum]MBT3119485.1 UTP--glucose-1-phosphate uridylyltransferase GalU [Bacillus inaquosorum]MBT3121165.1 UTP--glucose-1-phosphate uridylyltransferase GalU [Bacillus inaquosorum]
MRKKVRKAVIPAAGLGTRFLPATKAQPKEMLPIVDKPAIQYIVEEAAESGIEDILIITGRNKRSIEDHFDRSAELEFNLREKGKTETLKEMQQIADLANIHYIRQKEPLGLGHAVLCAEHFIGDEPFAVLLGDDIMVSEKPALRQLMDVYDAYGTEVVGVQSVLPEDVSKYGIINTSGSQGHVYEVKDLVEKPSPEEAPSEIAVMGRYVLNSLIFPVLKSIGRGAGNEIQLTDALREVCCKQPIHARLLEGNRYDIGDKLGCFKASTEIGLMRPEMRSQLLAYLEDVIKRETKEMLR